MIGRHQVGPADPFDLPDWLGVDEVTWSAETSIGGHRVGGLLRGETSSVTCDLLAGDLAYPTPVLEDKWRSAAHQAWVLGEVLLVEYDERLTLVLPGTAVDPAAALDALRRLARAVGADPERFQVHLRL